MTTYRSKVDRWLLVPVVLGGLIPAIALVYAAVTEPRFLPDGWWAFAILLVVEGFVVWVFTSTRYVLEARDLWVKSGPFRWRVPLSSIEAVRPTRNPLSSPALSLDRLELRYAGGRTLMISPAERERFLADLGSRAPQVAGQGTRA